MRFFRKSSEDEPTPIKAESEEDSNNTLSRITNYLNNNYVTKIEAKAQSMVETTQNYQIGLFLLFTGLIFIFLSLVFLPMIVLAPYKFCALNAFGTSTLFLSLVFIRGSKILGSLFGREKIIYTMAFFVSLLGELYFSVINKSYIFVLVFLAIHLLSIGYLMLSILPGGVGFINGTFKYMFKFIAMIFRRAVKGDDNLLPI
jgi:hypothetical protein